MTPRPLVGAFLASLEWGAIPLMLFTYALAIGTFHRIVLKDTLESPKKGTIIVNVKQPGRYGKKHRFREHITSKKT